MIFIYKTKLHMRKIYPRYCNTLKNLLYKMKSAFIYVYNTFIQYLYSLKYLQNAKSHTWKRKC